MRIQSTLKYSIVLFLSLTGVTHTFNANQIPLSMQDQAKLFDMIFFAAYAHACEKNNVNPMRANIHEPELGATFTSKTHRTRFFDRIMNLYRRLNEEPEEKPTITIQGTIELNGQEEKSNNDFKNAIVALATTPNPAALVQCTKQDNENGSTITCTATCNLKAFKARMASFNQ